MFFRSKLLAALTKIPVGGFNLFTVEPSAVPQPGGLYNTFVRYNIRNHFPRPSERKRIKVHGWNKRMSIPSGQRIIMRRILKDKHVLSH